jgi:hypothetical protein
LSRTKLKRKTYEKERKNTLTEIKFIEIRYKFNTLERYIKAVSDREMVQNKLFCYKGSKGQVRRKAKSLKLICKRR